MTGAGLGGINAAVAALKQGYKVLLTEETDWIGGQITSQGVPPDEHPWIEKAGCTASYRKYRNKIRDFYKENLPLTDEFKNAEYLNPGQASVSHLSHDPRIALHIFNEMLLPYLCNSSLTLMLNTKPIGAHRTGRLVKSITLDNTGELIVVEADYFIDATETGYLLPITGTGYVKGAESKKDTGEMSAPDEADSDEMQPITWVCAVDYDPNGDHTIDKPAEYDFYKKLDAPFGDCKVISWYGPEFGDPPDFLGNKKRKFKMFDGDEPKELFPLWSYRRIACKDMCKDGFIPTEITFINWPQNDYFLDNIYETGDDERNIYMAKQLTLSLIYWLQTEAERPDGGKGYKGVRMRGDITGTEDGLAKAPYIRESRRIKAEFTMLQQHIAAELTDKPTEYFDSVGVGCYRIDLHLTTRKRRHFFQKSWPFELPLGSFISTDTDNVIPGCKNIGTTQLTNGCCRVHPSEWNIGEAAGHIASFALKKKIPPTKIRNNPEMLKEFLDVLVNNGFQLHWDKDLIYPV